MQDYCCINIKTKDSDDTLCNMSRPRCYLEIRQIARLIRRQCLIAKWLKLDFDVNTNLQMEG